MTVSTCNSCEPTVDRSSIAALVKKASSSFYWAMRILAKPKREAIFSVYAFCRAVDDVADGPIKLEVKHTALASWRKQINTLFDPAAETGPKFTIVQALKQPVHDFNLRQEDFLAVIDGMQMDADGPIIAPSREKLDLYCDRVAAAVGRLCVSIFGEPGDKGLKVAHHQGRALQLTNILRDVAEDASEGRLYLPREYLQQHQISFTDPETVMQQPGFVALWRQLAQEAEQEYDKTYTALDLCDRRKMRASYIMADIYHLNLKRMMALSDTQLTDPHFNKRLVGKFEKLAIALKHLWT